MTCLVLEELRIILRPGGSRWPVVITDHVYKQTLHSDSWDDAARALIRAEYRFPEPGLYTADWIDRAASARRRFAIDPATVLQGVAMAEGGIEPAIGVRSRSR